MGSVCATARTDTRGPIGARSRRNLGARRQQYRDATAKRTIKRVGTGHDMVLSRFCRCSGTVDAATRTATRQRSTPLGTDMCESSATAVAVLFTGEYEKDNDKKSALPQKTSDLVGR